MNIRFLGTGGAFHVHQGNSAALVQIHGKTVLVDCGHSVFPTLVKKDLLKEVDAVLITHFHDDHVGSLSSLILFHDIILAKGAITLYVPDAEFQSQLENFLSFSLGPNHKRVDYQPISKLNGATAVNTFGLHVPGMQTWAYVFQEEQETIAFSGDIGQPKPFFDFLRAQNYPGLQVFHEATFFPGVPAHTHYKDLENYADEFEIYAYHCYLEKRPADLRIKLVADQPDFLA